MQIPNILIAEDDAVLREVYTRKFSRMGYAVRTAENGQIAAEMIRKLAPDLLLCDILMPGRDGWWLLEEFPKQKRSFPVIMLTNLEDQATRKRSNAFADGYFVKRTMTLQSLLEMTAGLLERRKKQ
ncbi:response regulator [Candidatus Peribacteria bacterium]|nr:response regulator [Candidatus Peribacteria bacterium]